MGTKSNRRSFLINATLLAGGAFSAQSIFYQGYGTFFEGLSARYQAFSPGELAVQEDYWAENALEIPGVKLHTSLKAPYSCAIAGVSVEGLTPKELENHLFSRFQIHTVAIPYLNLSCVRDSPHVYTRLSDLDKFVRALGILAAEHSPQNREEKGA